MSKKQTQHGEDRPEFCHECGLLWGSLWCCPTGDPEGPQTPQTPQTPDCDQPETDRLAQPPTPQRCLRPAAQPRKLFEN